MLLQRRAYRTVEWKAKRLLDIIVSGVALALLSPLMVTIAVISRITDGPGIIFRQVRISTDGEPFEIMKFRSLRPASDEESATKWNVKNDDRMNGFGRFIRKTSIDELPQLFNILRGDMSLVGPRPERPHFVEEFGSEFRHYGARHRVPSGLTGWAQIHGLRGDTSIEERAIRQLLHPALVTVARHQDHDADGSRLRTRQARCRFRRIRRGGLPFRVGRIRGGYVASVHQPM